MTIDYAIRIYNIGTPLKYSLTKVNNTKKSFI